MATAHGLEQIPCTSAAGSISRTYKSLWYSELIDKKRDFTSQFSLQITVPNAQELLHLKSEVIRSLIPYNACSILSPKRHKKPHVAQNHNVSSSPTNDLKLQ